MEAQDKVKLCISNHELRRMYITVVTREHAGNVLNAFTSMITTSIRIHGNIDDVDSNPISIDIKHEDIGAIEIIEINQF